MLILSYHVHAGVSPSNAHRLLLLWLVCWRRLMRCCGLRRVRRRPLLPPAGPPRVDHVKGDCRHRDDHARNLGKVPRSVGVGSSAARVDRGSGSLQHRWRRRRRQSIASPQPAPRARRRPQPTCRPVVMTVAPRISLLSTMAATRRRPCARRARGKVGGQGRRLARDGLAAAWSRE